MGVNCFILNEADMAILEAGNPYANGSCIMRAPRQGGTDGNPDPCFILNTSILTHPDFAAAAPYLSGLPVKNTDDPDYPAAIEED